MKRYAVNPSQLLMWSTPDKDDYYPISHGVIDAWRQNETLPLKFVENLQTPINVVKKLFFKNSNHSLLKTAGNGESQNAPRYFCQEHQMELFTENDAKFAWGLSNVVLNGFSINEEDYNDFARPDIELAIHDPLGGSPPVDRHELPTSGESNSRKTLELAKETRYKWTGCSEGTDCLYYPRKFKSSEALKEHNWNSFHTRTNCRHNTGNITTLISNFDINASSPDTDIDHEDKEKFIHIFSIRTPDKQELQRQINKVCKKIPFRASDYDGPSPFAAFELGFLITDSSLQGSLLNDQRNQMRFKRHDFLGPSETYREQQELLSHSLPPPALPNPSQLYNFALCYQHLLDNQLWPSPLTDIATPKSASDPGI